MLRILSTHPIQYQIPVWQMLAKDGRVPFEVLYLSEHGARQSQDRDFGKAFAWDLNTLDGYRYRFLPRASEVGQPSFWNCRLASDFSRQLRKDGTRALWIQGWNVAAYWQAAWGARAAGCELWMRAESNDHRPIARWKRPLKRFVLSDLFDRIDRFLFIGKANRRLYESYGVRPERLHFTPYAVDNERFSSQADAVRSNRAALRQRWAIPENAFCVVFCGKFMDKKRPTDLIEAAKMAQRHGHIPNVHLLFVGSGELGTELRSRCAVVFDAESSGVISAVRADAALPRATFTGFLNQTEISEAYVAADCLALPSNYGETWGLVVNEAMASGLPCVASDQCGCTEDLIAPHRPAAVFSCGDIEGFARALAHLHRDQANPAEERQRVREYSIERTVQKVVTLYRHSAGQANSP